MNIKKLLALAAALMMVLSALTGCGGGSDETLPPETQPNIQTQPVETQPEIQETQPAETLPPETLPAVEEVYDPGTALDWVVSDVTDDGYGRTVVQYNNIVFQVGDTVRDLKEAGLDFDDEDVNKTLAPWACDKVYAFHYDENNEFFGFVAYVLNDSPEARVIPDCRVFYVSLSEEGTVLGNGLVIGQSTEAEVLATFGAEEARNLKLGTSVNSMTASVYDGVLGSVELTYLDHIFDSFPFTTEDGEEADSLTLAVMSHYMDVSNYMASSYASNYDVPDLNETLGVEQMEITVAGNTLYLGPNGTTYSQLADLGWTQRELEEDYQVLEAGYYLSMYMDPASTGSFKISAYSVCNYTEEDMDTVDCPLKGITVENPRYFETANDLAPDFNFYGITANSTIQDMLELFGEPSSISLYAASCEVTFNYDFEVAPHRITNIDLVFNFMTNQLIQLRIF